MNATKILVIAGFAVAAVSANAQINLTGAGSFTLGGTFAGLGVMPSYTPGSSITSIVVPNGPIGGGASLNQWWFSVTDTVPITTVTYSITVNDINASTVVSGLITGQSYNSGTSVVGPQYYIITPIFTNVELYTGSNASTQTLTFTENITGSIDLNTGGPAMTAFFKGNFQFANVVPEPTGVAALAIGALGLLIRRRRTK